MVGIGSIKLCGVGGDCKSCFILQILVLFEFGCLFLLICNFNLHHIDSKFAKNSTHLIIFFFLCNCSIYQKTHHQ